MSMELGELSNRKDLSAVGATRSEATKIEQSRAFGEVIIQAELAKKFPRRMTDVFRRIDETFEMSPELVAGAKYDFNKGGRVTGYSVLFARAVASCVGNIHYSLKELNRDESQTEMHCNAWDIETNAMQTKTFIVKHERYGAKNPAELKLDRDIYENNTNVGARRLRECILDVLPAAAVKYAERKVEELLTKAFLPEKQKQYADENVKRFSEIGVTKEMLTKNRGDRPPKLWTKEDFASLANYYDLIEKKKAEPSDFFEISPKKTGGKSQNETADKLSGKGKQSESSKPNQDPDMSKASF
ncbi:MAG: hypothetical protein P8X74_03770 [Reinekea sp.]